MKSNIGATEKWIRLVVGAGLVLMGLFGGLPAWGTAVSIAVGLIALVTAALNFCPVWAILGINTRKS